ncbi:MAG: adenylate/guanylate cyclase domain-containing protein [Polyangia bacterium]
MKIDTESLTLTEIIQLQTLLSQTLQRRFEQKLALAFTDVAGSTQYFARYGDEAGRRMVQRHIDLLNKILPGVQGRIVDTAGDGAFTCFPAADAARYAMVELQKEIMHENLLYSREQQLVVRCGIHYGPVLTDGKIVTGDAVNLCARVASSASGGEILVTRAAFHELAPVFRLRCRDVHTLDLKGIGRPVEVLTVDWLDASAFPAKVVLLETHQEFALPDQDLISFGRLRELKGLPANDIALELPDPQQAMKISRWQFELRRRPDGFVLRPVSEQVTEVDGVVVAKGQEVPLRAGMKVRVARLLTLEFKAPVTTAASGSPETHYGPG